MRTVPLLLVLIPSTALAGPIEIGAALGAHSFAKDTELGVADLHDEPGPESGAMVGVRIAYGVLPRLAIEGEAMVIPTKDDVLHDRAMVYGLRAHARFDLLTGRIRPFVVAGLGMHVLRSSSPQMDNDVDRSYHWGGGVRYAVTPALDVRIDLRHLIVPDRTIDGATSDFELTAGVTYTFGRPKPEPRPVIAAPIKPGDRDGDGILDDKDQCPTQPEDKDGFQDEDGCPDPDNDNDGIVDAQDRCPDQPETRNGWQDDDGCPDQVIQELTGIAFELDSATIDSASAPLLDHAFQLLHDHPQLHVEISGHTSTDGDAAHNLDLSLRRARAVKAYLVKRGIAEERVLTVGHGSDVPIADNATEDGRRKNRRIEFRILTPADMTP